MSEQIGMESRIVNECCSITLIQSGAARDLRALHPLPRIGSTNPLKDRSVNAQAVTLTKAFTCLPQGHLLMSSIVEAMQRQGGRQLQQL